MQTTRFTRLPGLALAVMLMLLVGQGLVVGNDDRLDSCNAGTVTVLATFNPANQELPDGIAVIPGHGNHPGTPIVGFNPKGQAVYVAPDGSYTNYATFSSFTSSDRLLGLDSDRHGNVYLAVASFAPTIPGDPLPGIYKVAAGSDTPTRFSSPSTPPMTLPNGIELVGTDLYVADSNGFIFKVDSSGNTVLWSNHPSLVGNQTACSPVPLPTPRPFGADGITHDKHNVYITNFDYGRIVRFPIKRDGTAGTPVTVVQSCAYQGAKGIAVDKHGSLLFNSQLNNTLYRVAPDGTVTVLLSGKPPFDQPGNMRIDGHGKHKRLLVPNFARNSVLANNNPLVQLLSIELGNCPGDDDDDDSHGD